MDKSLSNYELTTSVVKTESDSSEEKSDHLYEMVDSDGSSNGSTTVKVADDDFDNNLPETVSVLRHPNGAKVYLVGTAHFSRESQEDVSFIIKVHKIGQLCPHLTVFVFLTGFPRNPNGDEIIEFLVHSVIRNVRPHIVVLELCSARTNILALDEETVLREAKNIDMDKIMSAIRTNGVYNGLMYILLLNMSAHLTREVGMAPGGEFRVAFREATNITNCKIHLGDRPINITLKRALSKLSWFQTIKLAWHLLTSKEPVSVEEIEKCKKRDMLEQLLAELAGEYPAFGEVFLDERDVFLTHSLQAAAQSVLTPELTNVPPENLRVVGVVGIGHVVGITKLWPTSQHQRLKDILTIPPPSLSSKVIRITFRVSLLTLGGYLLYRYVPVPKSLRATCANFVQTVLVNVRQIQVTSPISKRV